MHPPVLDFVAARTADLQPGTVLEVGSRDVNGSPRYMFPGAAYTGVDLMDGPGVDVVADIRTWKPKPAATRFDLVLCLEVLEHTPHVADVVAACWQLVRKGGLLIITCATTGRDPHSAVDGGPLRDGEHYENVTDSELFAALPDVMFDVEVHPDRGDLYAAARRS